MKRAFYILTAVTALLALGSWINSKDFYAEAVYPGGMKAVDRYMNDSMRYPEAEKKAGKEGFFIVDFEVSKTGKAENPVLIPLMDTSAGFSAEVRRRIAAMPAWEPAMDKKGRPVSSSHRTYVKFELPDSLISIPPSGDTTGEQMPRFAGAGEAGFQNYLHQTIRYPDLEKQVVREGTVYIYFDVEVSGRITNVKCVRGVPGAPGLTEEAIRVISLMPRWIPARKDGKPVKVGMTVPVKFTLQ